MRLSLTSGGLIVGDESSHASQGRSPREALCPRCKGCKPGVGVRPAAVRRMRHPGGSDRGMTKAWRPQRRIRCTHCPAGVAVRPSESLVSSAPPCMAQRKKLSLGDQPSESFKDTTEKVIRVGRPSSSRAMLSIAASG